MINWDVDPEIFRIGFVAIRWYSLLFMLSFAIGISALHWIYKREGKPLADLDQFLIYMLFGTVLGARLGHCFFYDPAYYLSNPLRILKVWEGGLASHGATIGIIIALYIYSRRKQDQSFIWVADRLAIPVALAASFVRMGNLFNSEIIGAPADVPWSFIFVRVDMIPRHPTQLYEALAYLIIFFILLMIYKKKGAKTEGGLLTGLFLVLLFGFRFFVEFLKENQSAFEEGMILDMGQLLSIPLVITGIIFLFHVKAPDITEEKDQGKKKNNNP